MRLEGSPLWLDAHRKTPLSFVSHAHADHIARHERVIATAATIRLLEHRLGRLSSSLPVPYNRPFELGPLVVELLPAGHILGSAQLRVVRKDGARVTFTGDLNLSPCTTAEPAQVAECDVLILESTFGHPRYRFPPRERTLEQIVGWIEEQLTASRQPILLAYAVGKAQEILHHLSSKGFSLCADPSICEVTQVYADHGIAFDKTPRRYDGQLFEGEVGVFPPHRLAAVRRAHRRAIAAVLTGWALDPVSRNRCGADAAFPLSDHADSQALIDYAKATGASEVLTHHGFAKELAEQLRSRGLSARPVGHPRQLELF